VVLGVYVCVCVCVRPAATARRNAALVSAAKVMRCIKYSSYSILMKFAIEVRDQKSKNAFVRGSISDDPCPTLPHFLPPLCFTMVRSEHCSNEARVG